VKLVTSGNAVKEEKKEGTRKHAAQAGISNDMVAIQARAEKTSSRREDKSRGHATKEPRILGDLRGSNWGWGKGVVGPMTGDHVRERGGSVGNKRKAKKRKKKKKRNIVYLTYSGGKMYRGVGRGGEVKA